MPRMTIDIPGVDDPHDRALRAGHGLWGYWSKSPWAMLLWASVIVWCFATLPSATTSWPAGAPRLPNGADSVPRASIVRRAGVIVAVTQENERPDDTVLGAAWYDYRLRPDFEQQSITITGTGVPLRDLPAARAAYLKFLGTLPGRYWPRVAAAMTPGDKNDTLRFHGRRVAQTVLAVMVFPLLVRSLAWATPILAFVLRLFERIPAADPIERERRRRQRRLAAGQCPGCGYSIIGLPRRKCPECGQTWTAQEEAG